MTAAGRPPANGTAGPRAGAVRPPGLALVSVPGLMLGLMLGLGAAPAQGHLADTGLGPFYDGAAHLLMTPALLLPLLALALLAGQQGPAAGRALAWALPGGWAIGALALAPALGAVVAATGAPWPGPVPLALLAAAIGGLVAAGLPRGHLPIWLVAGAVGMLLGSGEAGCGIALLGTLAALTLVTLPIAGQTAALRALPLRAGVRAAGSWIAAIGLLSLGWALR